MDLHSLVLRLRRTVPLLFALLMTLALGSAVVASPAQAASGSPVKVGYNGKCLDADLNTIGGNGTKVQLWDCNGSNQQRWYRSGDTIRSGYNGRCLDLDLNNAHRNGAVVQLWDCNGSHQQKWSVKDYVVRSGQNARCLDADLNRIGQNGAQVQSWDCNGSHQQWWIGLPNSAFQSSCRAYGNDQVWQTSRSTGRVREQMCVETDRVVVLGIGNFQLDFPAQCSIGVGVPPSASLSCPSSWYTKSKELGFNSVQIMVKLTANGFVSHVVCNWGKQPYRTGQATWTCSTQAAPYRGGTTYNVEVHDTGGDVTDDGTGIKLLNGATGSFFFA